MICPYPCCGSCSGTGLRCCRPLCVKICPVPGLFRELCRKGLRCCRPRCFPKKGAQEVKYVVYLQTVSNINNVDVGPQTWVIKHSIDVMESHISSGRHPFQESNLVPLARGQSWVLPWTVTGPADLADRRREQHKSTALGSPSALSIC